MIYFQKISDSLHDGDFVTIDALTENINSNSNPIHVINSTSNHSHSKKRRTIEAIPKAPRAPRPREAPNTLSVPVPTTEDLFPLSPASAMALEEIAIEPIGPKETSVEKPTTKSTAIKPRDSVLIVDTSSSMKGGRSHLQQQFVKKIVESPGIQVGSVMTS